MPSLRRIPTEIAAQGSLGTGIFIPRWSKGNYSHEVVIKLSEQKWEGGIYWSRMENKRSGKLSCLWKPWSQTPADAGTRDYGNYLGKLAWMALAAPECHWGSLNMLKTWNWFFLCHIAFFDKMRNELENDTWTNLQHSLALDSFGNRIGEAEHIMLLLCSARFLNIEASLQSVF